MVLQYSFGLIYTDLLALFGETYQETAWIGSLQQSCGFIFCEYSL